MKTSFIMTPLVLLALFLGVLCIAAPESAKAIPGASPGISPAETSLHSRSVGTSSGSPSTASDLEKLRAESDPTVQPTLGVALVVARTTEQLLSAWGSLALDAKYPERMLGQTLRTPTKDNKP